MNNWIKNLSLSIGLCLALVATAAKAQEVDTSIRKNLLLNTRAGFLFDTADGNIDRKWNHDMWNSFMLNVGIYYTFPVQWREFYFFAGPELSYMDNEEYIEANGRTSTLSTTYLQTWLTGGITFRPAALDTDWYFSAFMGVSPWGQVDTDVGGVGYTRSLKTKNTSAFSDNNENSFYGGASLCYDFFWEWSGCVAYEYRTASTVTLGINYGFN
jgi:hypothetical protein